MDDNIPTFAIQYRGVEQLVARRAHNPKVVGSSPASATNEENPSNLSPCFARAYFIF